MDECKLIIEAFNLALTPEGVASGRPEKIIDDMKKLPQFLSILLKIVADPSLNINLRLASATQIHNCLRHFKSRE